MQETKIMLRIVIGIAIVLAVVVSQAAPDLIGAVFRTPSSAYHQLTQR
jgi:hypothetical protein